MEKSKATFNKYIKKLVAKKIILRLIDVGLVPLALPLFCARLMFNITFFRVHGGRIGHLAMNNEILLRKRQLGREKGTRYIGIAHTSMCNQQLVSMLKKKMRILQIPQPRFVRAMTKIMATNSILSRQKLFVVLPHDLRDFQEFNTTAPSLAFTEAEQEKGKKLLQNLTVKDNWFICFHARDQEYIGGLLKRGDSRYLYRNCDINNYLEAVEYVTKQGGYALRMGAKVGKKLPPSNNSKIIDYAASHRTELGDIYLPANCRFFLGVNSGLTTIPYIFNVPVALANLIPLTPVQEQHHFPPGRNDLFIPKKIWSKKLNRFLTFTEIIDFERKKFNFESEDYDQEDLVPVENTSQEIIALAVEMHERLQGTWKETKEDRDLQEKFRSLFEFSDIQYKMPCRVGAAFLRENKFMLE